MPNVLLLPFLRNWQEVPRPSPTLEALPIIWRPGDSYASEEFAGGPATYVDVNGVIQYSLANVKRTAAYLAGYGPGFLLEEERRDIALWSDDYDPIHGDWLYSGSSWTDNAATAPDGTINGADRLTQAADGTIRQHFTTGFSPGDRMIWGFWAKNNGGTNADYRVFDFTAGADVVAVTSYLSQLSSTLWKRIVVPFTVPAGCSALSVYIHSEDSPVSNPFDAFIWGADLFKGNFDTSTIPTVGAGPVTRPADSYSIRIPAGVPATEYWKYYDLSTGTLVEGINDTLITDTFLVWDANRLWLRHAVVAGTKTLSEMQALYGTPRTFVSIIG